MKKFFTILLGIFLAVSLNFSGALAQTEEKVELPEVFKLHLETAVVSVLIVIVDEFAMALDF